ncbi:hypothetical protein M1247_05070 [Mycobacterium sp. 21AC1]|uniref:hypothetical protein n=1 Tax=[Mycobacterium] appelbergii TaxID=2939269 RepID=UPI002939102D|nr:hypothetical protein [Mycobacterium sp. 21AC1]MDV3124275.1 hypothetical protein [Mycobacterium sp. 21AC1]
MTDDNMTHDNDDDVQETPDQPDDQVVDEAVDDSEESDEAPEATDQAPEPRKREIDWPRVVVFGVLPALALLLAAVAGFLKWQDNSVRHAETAASQAKQAAHDTIVAMLSYQPDQVDQQLGAARELLADGFQQQYTELTTDVVIPAAKQQQVTAEATVPAVASVSATPDHVVVLAFVNQSVTVGQNPPSATDSSVRVTLDKIDGRWLISEFQPI